MDDIISESVFDCLWSPEVDATGDLLTFEQVKDKPIGNVWTVLEVGDHMVASAGFHIVNKLGYLITAKPWETGLECAYWFQADPPECGHSACSQNFIETGDSYCLVEEDGE